MLNVHVKRLAIGTVQSLIDQLKSIFEDLGLGNVWDRNLNGGSYGKKYLKTVKKEQPLAHIVPKQAKPLFLDKVRALCYFIYRKLQSTNLSLEKRFLYLGIRHFSK